MRQFYDEERIFRITGKSGESEFVRFSGQVLRAQLQESWAAWSWAVMSRCSTSW